METAQVEIAFFADGKVDINQRVVPSATALSAADALCQVCWTLFTRMLPCLFCYNFLLGASLGTGVHPEQKKQHRRSSRGQAVGVFTDWSKIQAFVQGAIPAVGEPCSLVPRASLVLFCLLRPRVSPQQPKRLPNMKL